MKISKVTLASAAVAIGMATLAAGCGSNISKNSTTTGAPQKGGTLTVALQAQYNLDWYLPINNSSSGTVSNFWLEDQIYKPLIQLNNAYQIAWNSSIASNITYNTAGTVYHVFLNKKWKWSNGTPVTATDLMFTWNVVKAASAANVSAPWPFLGEGTGDIPNGVKSVVANNNYEVTFTLDKPANQQWFIYNGLIQLPPMPAAQLDRYGSNWAEEVKYLGSIGSDPSTGQLASDGPYELKSATPSQNWVLTPNPDYGGHKSHVSKLIFVYEGSDAAEFSALKTGTIKMGYVDETQAGAAKELTAQGDKLVPDYALATYYTELNMYPGTKDSAIMNQLYVRKALEESIDQQALVKDVYKGYAIPGYGPISSVPRTKFYDAAAEPPIPFNLKAAKAILENHGWHDVNGVMTKGSQKMNFTMIYVAGTATIQDLAEILQADWKKIGVVVNLEPKNPNEFGTLVTDKTSSAWQLATGGWLYNGPGWYPTGGILFGTGAAGGTGYSNSHEDALIAATHQPYATEAQSMKAFDAYEAYTASQVPFLWEPNWANPIWVMGAQLHGGRKYANPATGNPQFNRMWLSK